MAKNKNNNANPKANRYNAEAAEELTAKNARRAANANAANANAEAERERNR